MNASEIFNDLFVLEMTNNHLGSVERGLNIIKEFARVVRFNNVKAAIKLQFRDVENFIHKDYRDREDIRYIKRTLETQMSDEDYSILVKAIIDNGCIPMATPFDERSVDLCTSFNMPIIKVASADSNDWFLLEKIAKTKKPVIISIAGTSEKDTDDLITFFKNRNIPMAVNHCVAAYPTQAYELELNQIDYLKYRYPDNVIGLSTHESHETDDYIHCMYIAVAKGVRLFERHIDIDSDGVKISPYSYTPKQIDGWFKAFNKAKVMCGSSGTQRRMPMKKEIDFLDNYIRGVYVKKDLPQGHVVSHEKLNEDFYLAFPLQKGQLSCRELMNGEQLTQKVDKDKPLKIDDIDGPYSNIPDLKELIYKRGL
jgi:N-acetylneuraminate synthase